MKIVIIGGTGLIGSKTADRLRKQGHDVIAASPNTGVDTITGTGLAEVLAGAAVVIDLANSPSFEDRAVLGFFETSGRNLIAAAKTAGVQHHIALSIIGLDLLPDSGYMRAKVAQERIIRNAGIPYTIVRSTQFMEFLAGIAQSGADGDTTHVSTAFLQPIASDDVADNVADIAMAKPIDGIVEISGPERAPMSEFVARYLKATGDTRKVVADPDALYFGTRLQAHSLVSDNNPRLGRITFEQWFATSARR